LIDQAGQAVTNRLPQSLDEFQQAVDQTKQEIFKRYDDLAQRAGKRTEVSLSPTIDALRGLANSSVIKDLSPSVANHANALADRLSERGSYTTKEAQDAIQHLNQSLRGYYNQAPTREVVGSAGIDALIANNLREDLDRTISAATGEDYQALKNQYGALRKLEKDVVHRAIVTGRQELGGGLMGRLSDVVSAEEVIRGVMHLEPTAIATGAGLRAWRGFVRYLRDPNRAVRRIFDAADKLQNLRSDPARQEIAAGLQRVAPVAGAASINQMMTPSYGDIMRRAAEPVSPSQ
jgi:polyhydroxyalkanoate synthesis regulator phasin